MTHDKKRSPNDLVLTSVVKQADSTMGSIVRHNIPYAT